FQDPDGLSRGVVGEDQRLQQRVARQAIRSVNSRTGHLSHREEAIESRPGMKVGQDAAAAVMRRRNDRNRLARDVDTELKAALVDIGETGADMVRLEVGEVEVNVIV